MAFANHLSEESMDLSGVPWRDDADIDEDIPGSNTNKIIMPINIYLTAVQKNLSGI